MNEITRNSRLAAAGFSEVKLSPYGTGSDEWVLLEDLTWREWLVPAGYVCDLSSIPWIAAPFFHNEHRPAGVLHDWWYNNQYDREVADENYRIMVRDLGASAIQAEAMFRALRLGGWYAYWKSREGASWWDFAPEYMSEARVALVGEYLQRRARELRDGTALRLNIDLFSAEALPTLPA